MQIFLVATTAAADLVSFHYPFYCKTAGFHLETFTLSFEGLRERTEYIDIFLFFRPSLNRRVLFLMFCLLVEGECQILMF